MISALLFRYTTIVKIFTHFFRRVDLPFVLQNYGEYSIPEYVWNVILRGFKILLRHSFMYKPQNIVPVVYKDFHNLFGMSLTESAIYFLVGRLLPKNGYFHKESFRLEYGYVFTTSRFVFFLPIFNLLNVIQYRIQDLLVSFFLYSQYIDGHEIST